MGSQRFVRRTALGRWKLYQQTSGQLGQEEPTTYDPGNVLTPPDFTPGFETVPTLPLLPSTQPVDTTMVVTASGALIPPTALAPSQPGVNPSTQAAYANLLTQQQNSKSPLDYVSPQAAIAAGLNPNTVYAAWSQALARFPTQQAALNAGIPAGVVTQLWAQSRTAAPASTSGTILGIPTTTALAIGGGILLLPLLLGHRGRR